MAIDKDVAMSFLVKFDADDTKLAKSIAGIDSQADSSKKTFAEWAKSLDGNLKAVADSSKILHERIKEVGKGIAFGIVADQFKNLKGAIDGTAASALSAGASGAAMGATFAGPWGAAVGGAIGLAKGLVSGLLDTESAAEAARKKIEEQGTAYWAQVEAATRAHEITASLAAVQAELAEAERQATEAATEHNRVMNEGADAFRHAGDKARAYQDALTGVDYALRQQLELAGRLADIGSFADMSSGESEEAAAAIRNSRGVRDAMLDRYAATKSYGEALKELQGSENSHADRLHDLEGILGDVNVSQSVRNRALKEYNDLVTKATKHNYELRKSEEKSPPETSGQQQGRANAEYNQRIMGDWLGPKPKSAGENLLAALGSVTKDALGAINDGLDQTTSHVAELVQAAQPEGPTLLERLGLDDPRPFGLAIAAVQEFGEAWDTSLKAIGEGSMSASKIFRRGIGAVLDGVGHKFAALSAAEAVEAVVGLVLLQPQEAAKHGIASGLYAAGAVGAYAAASEIGGGGGGGSSAANAAAKQLGFGGGGGGGGGASASSSGTRGAEGFGSGGNVHDQRTGGGSGPGTREVFVIYTDAFADASPRVREQQARKKFARVSGGQGLGWSND